MGPPEVKIALQLRGVDLGNPASSEHLKQAERKLEVSFDEYWNRIYSEFDGFLACDARSFISLWTLDRILEHRRLSIIVDGRSFFAIGDVLIDSDFLMGSLESHLLPLFFLYERRDLAPTVSAFFDRLVSGDFDHF